MTSVRSAHGILSSRVEAERSLAGVLSDESANLNSEVTTLNNAISDSRILVQRMGALQIPPLSPDLGVLYQPDGRKFK